MDNIDCVWDWGEDLIRMTQLPVASAMGYSALIATPGGHSINQSQHSSLSLISYLGPAPLLKTKKESLSGQAITAAAAAAGMMQSPPEVATHQ